MVLQNAKTDDGDNLRHGCKWGYSSGGALFPTLKCELEEEKVIREWQFSWEGERRTLELM